MLDLIAMVLWLVLGAYIMFYKKEITPLDYFCAWFVLMVAYLVGL